MSHDDFAIEPVPGLPETPPEGEYILWQGRPATWPLLRAALAFWWVMGYFLFLGLWRFVAVIDLMPLGQALGASIPFLILGALVGALLWLTAFVQARSTVYTVTNKRVAMRIGAALTITLNLPYTQIDRADLELCADGSGTIVFATRGETRFAYLVCWPHLRPWHIPTKPAFRCIPEAERVAGLIGGAAKTRLIAVAAAPELAPEIAPAG